MKRLLNDRRTIKLDRHSSGIPTNKIISVVEEVEDLFLVGDIVIARNYIILNIVGSVMAHRITYSINPQSKEPKYSVNYVYGASLDEALEKLRESIEKEFEELKDGKRLYSIPLLQVEE